METDNKGRNRLRTITDHSYQPSTNHPGLQTPNSESVAKIWTPSTEESATDSRDIVEFTIALSSGLHKAGLSSKTVEDAVATVAEIFGIKASIFAVPTATVYSFGDEDR